MSRRILLVVLALGLAVWLVRPWGEAARVLVDLAGRAGAVAERSETAYQVGGRSHRGDLYPANGPSGAGLVVVPGAAALGKDDPRLIGFASALARAGFTVLVPDIESQRALQVGPENIQDIAALDLKGRDLSGLKAHLLLIHGRDDAIVPAGESRKLAAVVPSAQLFIVDDLAHADWQPKAVAGMWSLLRAVRALLDQRDRALQGT